MKTYIITMPDEWHPTGVSCGRTNEELRVILANAKEAVEVLPEEGKALEILEPVVEYPTKDWALLGEVVKLYAVKEKHNELVL